MTQETYTVYNIRVKTQNKLMWLLDYLKIKIQESGKRKSDMYIYEIDIIKRILNMQPVTKKEYQKVITRHRKVMDDEDSIANYSRMG